MARRIQVSLIRSGWCFNWIPPKTRVQKSCIPSAMRTAVAGKTSAWPNVLADNTGYRRQNSRSSERGEVMTGAVDFGPHVIVDRELITGQNPKSDHPTAAKLIAALAD